MCPFLVWRQTTLFQYPLIISNFCVETCAAHRAIDSFSCTEVACWAYFIIRWCDRITFQRCHCGFNSKPRWNGTWHKHLDRNVRNGCFHRGINVGARVYFIMEKPWKYKKATVKRMLKCFRTQRWHMPKWNGEIETTCMSYLFKNIIFRC